MSGGVPIRVVISIIREDQNGAAGSVTYVSLILVCEKKIIFYVVVWYKKKVIRQVVKIMTSPTT